MAVFIHGGTVVNADAEQRADVLIIGEKIAAVGLDLDLSGAPADLVRVDATGKFVLPGGIDTHTHLQLPFMGTVAVDDFDAGTRAAVAGGTTMVLDFVIPQKGESPLAAWNKWRGWADPKVHCDYGFHACITWWDGPDGTVAAEMRELVEKHGVASFKMFLAYKSVFQLPDDALFDVFSLCKRVGALAMVHAENGDVIARLQAETLAAGVTGPEGHVISRPPAVEAEATHRALTIAQCVGTPVYIVHVMSKEAAAEVARARAAGAVAFGEPIAAGLGVDGTHCFHADWRHAAAYVMSPPLRPDPTVKVELMRALAAGELTCVGTDNCTFNASQKALGADDFTRIPNGVNGIEDRMAVVWTKGVMTGMMPRTEFVRATSAAAAKLFGLWPRKGRVAAGADADVVVWDGAAVRRVSAATHHHACDFNIFEGMDLAGVAVCTLVRGRVVFRDGKFLPAPGHGRYVPRPAFAAPFDSIPTRDAARDISALRVARGEPAKAAGAASAGTA